METAPPLVRPFAFDHVNLATSDFDRALAFYIGVLGLYPVRLVHDASGKLTFVSLRAGTVFIDLQPADQQPAPGRSGFNHLCILVEPTDLDELAVALKERGVEIVEGPVRRQGAYGFGSSLYVRDPDGHVIEIKHHDDPRIPNEERTHAPWPTPFGAS